MNFIMQFAERNEQKHILFKVFNFKWGKTTFPNKSKEVAYFSQ